MASAPQYKTSTRSDTLKLRRFIQLLKERGSDLAEDIERKAQNFLSDVQVKRKPVLQEVFESDEEFSSFEEEFDESPEEQLLPLEPMPPPPPSPPKLIPRTPSPPPPLEPEPVKEPSPPPPKLEPKPSTPLPNRQQIRGLSKDTPSLSADKPKLTPDCKLYWIQKHLEQELEAEREETTKRRLAEEEEAARRRHEAEERLRLADLEKKRRQQEEEEEVAAKLREEEERRRRQEEEMMRRKEEEEEEERQRRLLEEKLRKEEEEKIKIEQAQREEMEEEEEMRRRQQEEEEEKERRRKEQEKKNEEEQKKHLKGKTERTKKLTMAREWRKLKEKQKQRAESGEVNKPPPPPAEKVEVEEPPPPPRRSYVPPVYKENENYDDRLGSYSHGWPHNHKKGIPTPSELAEAGFFLVGPGDFCKCFQCGLEQMCWEPFESPWVRHAFLSADCAYVERIKGKKWMEEVLRGEF